MDKEEWEKISREITEAIKGGWISEEDEEEGDN